MLLWFDVYVLGVVFGVCVIDVVVGDFCLFVCYVCFWFGVIIVIVGLNGLGKIMLFEMLFGFWCGGSDVCVFDVLVECFMCDLWLL